MSNHHIGQKDTFKDGFYRVTSERVTLKTVAQRMGGKWYVLNEVGPITLQELNDRGWMIDTEIRNMRAN